MDVWIHGLVDVCMGGYMDDRCMDGRMCAFMDRRMYVWIE